MHGDLLKIIWKVLMDLVRSIHVSAVLYFHGDGASIDIKRNAMRIKTSLISIKLQIDDSILFFN